MARILGIVSHLGTRQELAEEMEALLHRCHVRMQAWSRKESEPLPDMHIVHLRIDTDIASMLTYMRESDAVLLVASSHSLSPLIPIGLDFKRQDSDKGELRGISFGLIAYGDNDDWRVVDEGYGFLVGCNSAGMPLLPQALAHSRTYESRDHLRLAIDAATLLASQNEWTGRAKNSEAA